MNYIIQIKNITKNYGKGRKQICAVNNTSLNIEKGKITALLGPNGSGKSTLIKSICGLVEIDSGEILINDININSKRNTLNDIGCILEGERNIYYYLTVYDNLYYFGKLNKIRRSILKKKIENVLDQLDLTIKKNNYVSELSRGMQQKVALAILLIRDPEILLLDEPTLGLDVQSSIELTNYLLEICEKYGKTIILTTHQLDLAERISDNIILYQNGRVLLQNTKIEMLKKYQKDLEVKIIFNENRLSFKNLFSIYGELEDGNSLTTKLTHVSSIIEICNQKGIEIVEINSVNKSLQEIFLQVTG